ncbi:iron uptake transporter permease EfeU [Aestuariivirga litoralis]|uniref:iron uptake transporter permease EfeU n=1 Tax=Aestuariivirga litoralis TaxID=2650924 RepID=UPI0018C79775|nr:iron uptake transporter permease EfeU [Aestuariivirga litoralis]MBG1233392.1 iron transporter [Aestuariivirga litoralis]
MFIAFLIMLREGFEASLIVGILSSYLVQTGRRSALPSVMAGVAAAIAVSVIIGVLITITGSEFPQAEQELFESAVGLFAVFMLISMVFWMRKVGRTIKKELHDKVDAALQKSTSNWSWPLAGTAFLVTGREGLESVVFMIAIIQQASDWTVFAGAALGLLSAAVLGYAVFKGGMKLNMRAFFRWTGVFIILVAGGILANVLVHLHEAGIWNLFQETAFDLSNVLPSDSLIGVLLGGFFGYRDAPKVGELGIYLLFTIPALILFLMPQSPAPAPKPVS